MSCRFSPTRSPPQLTTAVPPLLGLLACELQVVPCKVSIMAPRCWSPLLGCALRDKSCGYRVTASTVLSCWFLHAAYSLHLFAAGLPGLTLHCCFSSCGFSTERSLPMFSTTKFRCLAVLCWISNCKFSMAKPAPRLSTAGLHLCIAASAGSHLQNLHHNSAGKGQ